MSWVDGYNSKFLRLMRQKIAPCPSHSSIFVGCPTPSPSARFLEAKIRPRNRAETRQNWRRFRAIYETRHAGGGITKGTIHKGRPQNLRIFGPPPSPLSAFHATYQYTLSAKFGDFSDPIPLTLDVIYEYPILVRDHS